MSRTITGSYSTRVTLSNTADNPIGVASTATLSAGLYGDSAGPWTITNNGRIEATVSAFSYAFRTDASAVVLLSASTFTNDGVVTAAGDYGDGVNLAVAGTVINAGSIGAIGYQGYGIYLKAGGIVTNSGTITASGTNGKGVQFQTTGSVSNAATISVSSSYGRGIYFTANGTVTNTGTITGTGTNGVGIVLHGGTVKNQAGLVHGTVRGISSPGLTVATITNAGSLTGVTGLYAANGSVTNQAGGTISGSSVGAVLGRGTLRNAGTILSGATTARTAASFGTTSNNALVLYPGAVFNGTVNGGNTVGSTLVSLLELASGASDGTFSGLASRYVNFNHLTIDAGASWTMTGTNAVAAGVTFVDAGTLSNYGTIRASGAVNTPLVELGTGAVLINANGANITANGNYAVGASVASLATVVNAGEITAASTFGAPVSLAAGGYVNNQSSGLIKGGFQAVRLSGITNSTLINSGYILGASRGAYVQNGLLSNASGGTIAGSSTGASLLNGTVDNAGMISGTGNTGVYLSAGSFTNAATGVVIGSAFGVHGGNAAIHAVNDGRITASVGFSGYGVTLENAGTIDGTLGTAVSLSPFTSERVIVDPGAAFIGVVNGGSVGGSISVLELASASSAGTLSGLGSKYTGFARVTIDAGATWDLTGFNSLAAGVTLTGSGTLANNGTIVFGSGPPNPARLTAAALTGTGRFSLYNFNTLTLAGTVASGQTIQMNGAFELVNIGGKTAFQGTVSGFGASGIIDVQGIGLAKSGYVSGKSLSLYSGTNHTGTKLFTFPSITEGGGSAVNLALLALVDDGQGGTEIACYLRGTRIRTISGEVPVEFLAVGDWVETLTGALAPIRWIGRRRYGLAATEGHAAVLPVLIHAGAIEDGLPCRDLCVSPEHALFIDGVLVAARHLTNGKSIVQRSNLEVVEYFHIELAEHAVIFAEGTPAETFVDCDHRAMFDNAASYTGGGAPAWSFCAPRVEEGEALEEIRKRINARAGITYGSGRGPLIGRLERVDAAFVEGWAQDASVPERPVWLEIDADGATAAFVLANRYRSDLEAAGLGSGRHAFRVPLARRTRRIEVRRVEDGAVLGTLSA